MHKKVLVVAGCSLYLNFLTLWSMRWCQLDTKLFARCSRVLVVIELVVSRTQCNQTIVKQDDCLSTQNFNSLGNLQTSW